MYMSHLLLLNFLILKTVKLLICYPTFWNAQDSTPCLPGDLCCTLPAHWEPKPCFCFNFEIKQQMLEILFRSGCRYEKMIMCLWNTVFEMCESRVFWRQGYIDILYFFKFKSLIILASTSECLGYWTCVLSMGEFKFKWLDNMETCITKMLEKHIWFTNAPHSILALAYVGFHEDRWLLAAFFRGN